MWTYQRFAETLSANILYWWLGWLLLITWLMVQSHGGGPATSSDPLWSKSLSWLRGIYLLCPSFELCRWASLWLNSYFFSCCILRLLCQIIDVILFFPSDIFLHTVVCCLMFFLCYSFIFCSSFTSIKNLLSLTLLIVHMSCEDFFCVCLISPHHLPLHGLRSFQMSSSQLGVLVAVYFQCAFILKNVIWVLLLLLSSSHDSSCFVSLRHVSYYNHNLFFLGLGSMRYCWSGPWFSRHL